MIKIVTLVQEGWNTFDRRREQAVGWGHTEDHKACKMGTVSVLEAPPDRVR
jgi:hypothetical protein